MTSALYSNPNYDENPDDRNTSIHELEEQFANAVEIIYGGKSQEEDEIDENDPFFAAARRGMDEINDKIPNNSSEDFSDMTIDQ